MKLSIVIPAYNEELRIKPMLDAYAAYFVARYGGDVEIIVVVNGSKDRTEDVVRGCAKDIPQVQLIVEPARIGKGGAILLGFQRARGDLVGFVDADGSTQPDAYQYLVDKIGGSDAIIASRWMPGAHVSPRQPLARRIASRIFNFLVRSFFGFRITDTQCGAKLFKGAALRRVMPSIGITRWAFDVDLLFQVHRAGYTIAEVPTTWRNVDSSQLNVRKASLEMFVAIIRLRLIYSPFRGIVTAYDRTLGQVVHLYKS